ncbi:MAG: cytochrome oxidase small assembly protein [Pigmentiphaga sp.]|nr:cytochrome oxidase small assembly protein [Pigmentiphaga sp.]MDX3907963.1 cytochrome oxidase small assembly protein [Pigmentiphaga sp.]
MVTPEQRRRNRRTGLALALLVIAFFLAVILRKVWLG